MLTCSFQIGSRPSPLPSLPSPRSESLPVDSASYDPAIYDKAFFAQITFKFHFAGYPFQYRLRKRIAPCPRALAIANELSEGSLADWCVCKLAYGMSRKHVLVLRALLVAAELDEDTATFEDLNDIRKRFQWAEYPVRERGEAVWDWESLVRLFWFVA